MRPKFGSQIRGAKTLIILYIYYHYKSSYQEGRVGIPLTGLTLPQYCSCPMPGLEFPFNDIRHGLFVISEKVRGDCSFC
jgi:hypothetical protein